MSEEKLTKTVINWYPGHMAKTRREITEKLALIDVVYEVVDSRMPISSRIIDIDEIVKNKPKIIIMTKYDMCDKEQTDKIIEFYKNSGNSVVCVDLIRGKNINSILVETSKISDKLNEDRKKKGLKPRNIRALVIGAPNVGKSTLINKLVGKKATLTGDKPGVTKHLGWIKIGKNIELLDSPGILWPKIENQIHALNLAAFSSIKEEIIDLENLSSYILKTMEELYPNALEERYGFSKLDDDIVISLNKIGEKRKTYLKGGEIDYDKVCRIIINDLREGSLGKVTFDRL